MQQHPVESWLMYDRIVLTSLLALSLLGKPLTAQSAVPSSAEHPAPQATRLNLTEPFHTRSAWQLVVTEGPPTQDYGGIDAPGALTICLREATAGPCISAPVTLPLTAITPDNPVAWEPHYLIAAKVVYPLGHDAAPFLLIVTGSLLSGDSDQIVSTQLVAYDTEHDKFHRVYSESTGHNNNQEIRFITEGPLQGSVISVEPQEQRPYRFWIVVNQLTPAGEYKQVLRYGSATRYNDGNRLAVIDSEMPNIEQHLGLWKLGDPLPVPTNRGGKPCLKPALRHGELWCN